MSESVSFPNRAERRCVLTVAAPRFAVEAYLHACIGKENVGRGPARLRSLKALDNGKFESLHVKTQHKGQRETATVRFTLTSAGARYTQITIIARGDMAHSRTRIGHRTLQAALDRALKVSLTTLKRDLIAGLPWGVVEVKDNQLG